MICSVVDCGREVKRVGGCGRGLCPAHYTRWRRGSELSTPLRLYRQTPWRRVVEAAIALAEAEGDRDYDRASHRLRNAARAWALKEATP